MYTENVRLGKYEGNPSELEAEIVHAASLDGCTGFGDVTEIGYYVSLVEGRRFAWIVFEDDQGFVDVTSFNSIDEARAAYNKMEDIYMQDLEPEDDSIPVWC